ncbi:Rho termination factor N-terminal domain-containing protein [Rothia sp. L_38]|uniref:Rho termination factor N-terminal domain-containing protein n=1 Tax=Rothia sp. L_38 TaxID=3422315 RepID=UPI003D6A81A7
MGKKPELSKELKRSSDKAQKRYVKAYAKALDKYGDEKKARKKAQKKLEKKYELVGKKYEKIADKPQPAPKGKDKGKDAATPAAGKGKKKAEKVKAEKKVEQKKSGKKDSKKKAKNNKKSAAQREAELILADVTEAGEETAGYEEILDAESLEPGDLEAFEGEEEAPELDAPDAVTEVGEDEGLAPEEADEPEEAEELYEETFASADPADFDEDLTTEPLAEAPAQEDAASAPDQQDDDQTFLVAEVRPLAELTRAELYELAKQLEVPGRSSMNKGDLLIAVRAAQ